MDDLFARITHSPEVMGGKPCLRGLRVTVGTVVGLLAAGKSHEEILADLPKFDALSVFAIWAQRNAVAITQKDAIPPLC